MIKRKRKQANLSQHELAQAIGVSANTVSKWENNLAKPAPANARMLKKFFRVTIGQSSLTVMEDRPQEMAVPSGRMLQNTRSVREEMEALNRRVQQLSDMVGKAETVL